MRYSSPAGCPCLRGRGSDRSGKSKSRAYSGGPCWPNSGTVGMAALRPGPFRIRDFVLAFFLAAFHDFPAQIRSPPVVGLSMAVRSNRLKLLEFAPEWWQAIGFGFRSAQHPKPKGHAVLHGWCGVPGLSVSGIATSAPSFVVRVGPGCLGRIRFTWWQMPGWGTAEFCLRFWPPIFRKGIAFPMLRLFAVEFICTRLGANCRS